MALSAALTFGMPGGGQEKVTICHKEKVTITIGAPAVSAHVANHGDTLGACNNDVGPVEPPPTTTTTAPPVGEASSEGPEHGSSHDPPPHSHDEMVLRCEVIEP